MSVNKKYLHSFLYCFNIPISRVFQYQEIKRNTENIITFYIWNISSYRHLTSQTDINLQKSENGKRGWEKVRTE